MTMEKAEKQLKYLESTYGRPWIMERLTPKASAPESCCKARAAGEAQDGGKECKEPQATGTGSDGALQARRRRTYWTLLIIVWMAFIVGYITGALVKSGNGERRSQSERSGACNAKAEASPRQETTNTTEK